MSIIIPFRNEAANIGPLLTSLASQDYRAPVEIILVNDRSHDEFEPVIHQARSIFPHLQLHCIDSPHDPANPLTGKQQALDAGAAVAHHPWLVFTDADMRFNPDWLNGLLAPASAQTPLIFGHTTITSQKHSLFVWFQHFQLAFLFTIAYALQRARIAGSCMGNNMAISRSLYNEIGGQQGIGPSIIEDRALYAAVIQKGLHAAAARPFHPAAATVAAADLHTFLHQALRWSRGGMQSSPVLKILMLLFGTFCCLLPAACFGALSQTATMSVSGGFIALATLIAVGFHKTGTQARAFLLPLFIAGVCLECIIVGGMLVTQVRPEWKGSRV